MDRSRVALVVPALNEAASIGNVVARAYRYGVPIVVDDGSTDATAEIALAAGAEVVRHSRNGGYDAALNSGFAHAAKLGVEWAITLDADGQHDPDTLPNFITTLGSGAEVVIGIRDRLQRFSEHMYARYALRTWGIADPLCGMKGYLMSVYQEHGCFDSCSSIGTELAICAAVRGHRIAQIPVPTRPRNGTPRFGNKLRANTRILRALVAVRGLTRSLPPAMG